MTFSSSRHSSHTVVHNHSCFLNDHFCQYVVPRSISYCASSCLHLQRLFRSLQVWVNTRGMKQTLPENHPRNLLLHMYFSGSILCPEWRNLALIAISALSLPLGNPPSVAVDNPGRTSSMLSRLGSVRFGHIDTDHEISGTG